MQKQGGGKGSVGLATHRFRPCSGCHTASRSITPLVEVTTVDRDGHALEQGGNDYFSLAVTWLFLVLKASFTTPPPKG